MKTLFRKHIPKVITLCTFQRQYAFECVENQLEANANQQLNTSATTAAKPMNHTSEHNRNSATKIGRRRK